MLTGDCKVSLLLSQKHSKFFITFLHDHESTVHTCIVPIDYDSSVHSAHQHRPAAASPVTVISLVGALNGCKPVWKSRNICLWAVWDVFCRGQRMSGGDPMHTETGRVLSSFEPCCVCSFAVQQSDTQCSATICNGDVWHAVMVLQRLQAPGSTGLAGGGPPHRHCVQALPKCGSVSYPATGCMRVAAAAVVLGACMDRDMVYCDGV